MVWAFDGVTNAPRSISTSTDFAQLIASALLMKVLDCAGLTVIAIALLVPGRTTTWNPPYVAALVFMAVVSTALGWWLWSYILERVPAWEASLSVLGTPVVAIVSSSLILGEAFQRLEVAGIMLIGAGLALLSFVGWRASQRRVAPGG